MREPLRFIGVGESLKFSAPAEKRYRLVLSEVEGEPRVYAWVSIIDVRNKK